MLILIRMTDQPWGPFEKLLSSLSNLVSDGAGHLEVHDRSGQGLARSGATTVHEWSCLAPGGEHAWSSYPALAAAAAQWIIEVGHSHPDPALLLGLVVPQNISLCLGILAHREMEHWPQHLWPVVFDSASRRLVIPNLDLGQTGLVNGQ